MPVERVFLGWDQPCLPAAADWLLRRWDGDLSEVTVGVPGPRAAERLLQGLVEAAEAGGDALRPPDILIGESLANRMLPSGPPIVPQAVRQLAWIEALLSVDADTLGHLTAAPPDAADLELWAALGDRVERLHTEVASAGLCFAEIAERGARLIDFADTDRWQALQRVLDRYRATLDAWHFADPQQARLAAVESGQVQSIGPLVLIGWFDMSPVLRAMLQQLQQQSGAVHALVFAPESLADRFDDCGAAIPMAWATAPIDLRDEQLRVVTSPADQADAVVQALAELGAASVDEVTLGLADPDLAPWVRQHLAAAGQVMDPALEQRLGQTTPVRLLASIADVLEDDGFAYGPVAALARHPDLADCVRRARGGEPEQWIASLDAGYGEHLPAHLRETNAAGSEAEPALALLRTLLAPLRAEPAPLRVWAAALAGLLRELYGGVTLDRHDPIEARRLGALQAAGEVLESWFEAPCERAMSARSALCLMVRVLEDRPSSSDPDPQALAVARWIELPLDDAPHLIVAGMNDGAVPRAETADAFLPDGLRRAAGLRDVDSRAALDAYALQAVCAGRRSVRLIAGRAGADGEPRVPSRLWFMADAATVARRVATFFPDREPVAPLRIDRLWTPSEDSLFADPERWPPPARQKMKPRPLNVTAFRDYLACPYRFYLKHVLKLGSVDDAAVEMDGAAFGSLAHDVLAEFGRSDRADSIDASAVALFLDDRLDQAFTARFGRHARPALQVQCEQLRRRLAVFAEWQARRAAEGWRIRHIELPVDRAPLPETDPPTCIRGRMDRLDRHERSGQWAIFDYKTGDSGRNPHKTHGKPGAWVDLQLPLYRHLAHAHGVAGLDEFELGFIVLGRDAARTGAHLANWGPEALADADDAAVWVAERIMDGVFGPPSPAVRFDDFAALCGAELLREYRPDILDDSEADA